MTNQEFMHEFYKDTDKRTGMNNLPPNVSGGRCALFMAYGSGENPYLTPEQWNDLKDFTPEELLGLARKATEWPSGATITAHPYPPYAQKEIVAPEVTSDFLG